MVFLSILSALTSSSMFVFGGRSKTAAMSGASSSTSSVNPLVIVLIILAIIVIIYVIVTIIMAARGKIKGDKEAMKLFEDMQNNDLEDDNDNRTS